MFFVGGDSLYVVPVAVSGSAIEIGAPAALYGYHRVSNKHIPWYDVSPDGERFVVVRPLRSESSIQAESTIHVMVNALEGVRSER